MQSAPIFRRSAVLRIPRIVSPFVLVLAGLSLSACDKDKDKTTATPAPSASVATVADATAPAQTDSGVTASADASDAGGGGGHAAHMANCPSASPGATVALKDVEGGIEISITGKDEAGTKDIK